MKHLTRILFFLCFASIPAVAAHADDTNAQLVEQYRQRYHFFEMKDTVYTIEHEFTLPEGFSYPADNKLSEYAAWIAHFPIWHKTKQIGSWEGGTAMPYDSVSRVIHLPWRGPAYTDIGFMVRVPFEYYITKGMENKMIYQPTTGDSCSYPQYLKSKLVYNSRGAVVWQPAPERPASTEEFYKFLYQCQTNTTYAGLIRNCEKVAPADVRPGDMFIAHDQNGRTGVVYLMLNMIENKSGEKRYAAATGCKNACDFHIALLNNDRNAPWVPIKTIEAQAPEGSIVSGFYRFKLK